jgi:RecQ family ATP-dependent DNA helicase
MLWTDKAKKILKKHFKFNDLKDKQIEVINSFLNGYDVIGLLPTGYGKSMTYILPPLLTKKTMFIICPLISLMEDQKDNLEKVGINVSTLHCNNVNKQEEIFKIIDGEIKIVYMSPEFLVEGDGLDLARALVEKNLLGFIAVDESHCISSWGHDFRPNYLKLKFIRDEFPQIPILALTATAKKQVINEIQELLKLNKPVIVSASFDRPNLLIKCKEMDKEQKYNKNGYPMKNKDGEYIYKNVEKWLIVKDYIEKYQNDKIIIYVNSRVETEELSKEINFNIKKCSVSYHAGLSKKVREKVQSDFSDGNVKVIISTIAFGMGIDQVVRCVIIFGCPSSIEEYYQQIGRGGRDGNPCETVLYFDMSNFMRTKSMLTREIKNPKLLNTRLTNLQQVCYFFKTPDCRRKYILNYFGQNLNNLCNNCDNCINKKSKDITPIHNDVDIFDKVEAIYKNIH